MENKESSSRQEVIVTKENLSSILTEIAVQREKKGTSEVLIPYIRKVREEVEKLGDVTHVVQLLQEEALCGKHMIMEEISKGLKGNLFKTATRAIKGLWIMKKTSNAMKGYLGRKGLDPVTEARIFRFLGRHEDEKEMFKRSEPYYRKGLEYFNQSDKIEERYNRLEFLGFLSFSLIKQGKAKKDEGIELAKQTLKDFDESDEGKWLRENNYYAWAVWKSGIELRTAEHIFKKKDVKNADLAKILLTDSENILRMPDGATESFRLRLDELNATKELVKSKF
jgi:hypothetical protein